ncbi:MAG: DUF1003 domain-containing protein [Dehalococcoidia bacterium]|nr:DUF1003 domain-containing protein [Dehalococcoidia bacterium]MCB9485099.1 DUF1003 domain-containing protein [Thermoflexaceae bacterium]
MTSRNASDHNLRHHRATLHLGSAFGSGSFGAFAETAARFFGTPTYLIGQSLVVVAWIIFNAVTGSFDPYPFILLNLAFSLQAAYAAPMILLAETRQADRDKHWSEADARHREELSETTLTLLQQNTDLTIEVQQLAARIAELTGEIHGRVVQAP